MRRLDKMDQVNNRKRMFACIRQGIIIKFKALNEYKINLYFAFLHNLAWISIQIIFLTIIYNDFNDFLGWTFKEYVFFVLFLNSIYRFFGAFFFDVRLNVQLLQGEINSKLLRPINVFLQYLISVIQIQATVVSFVYMTLFFIYILFFWSELDLFRLLLAIPFGILGGFFNFVVIRSFDSLAFFMKNNNFFIDVYKKSSNIFIYYPANMFKNNLNGLVFLIANVYYGTYATLFVFGKITYLEFYKLHIYLLLLNLFGVICIYLLWKYGLKRYEAFG